MKLRETAPYQLIRKHISILACAIILTALCIFLSIVCKQNDRCVIDAAYDEQTHTLTVCQTLYYTNRTGQALQEICFMLWPNAYAASSTAPAVQSERAYAYPKGFDAGGTQLLCVKAADQDAAYSLEGAQKTVLRVQLPFRLRNGGSTQITLTYNVQLPYTHLRMGYSDQDVRLSNVFAAPCVFEHGSFRTDAYSAIGDPFVSECLNWQVTFTAPESYVVCGAGLQETAEGKWVFSQKNARDFALFMSKDYHVAQTQWNDVTVRSFAFTEEGAQSALQYAAQALDVFSQLYGNYPYDTFSVCAGKFYVSGMEYPAVVLLDDSLYTTNDGLMEFVTAHETAHQWWYAGVGSDQYKHPWQDEALAEYSTLLYYESVYGADSFDSLYQSMLRPATESSALRGVGIDQSLDKFESTAAYDALIYRKGAAMLHSLRTALGNESFFAALRRYYKSRLFTIAQPRDFFDALGSDGAALAAQWLRGSAP